MKSLANKPLYRQILITFSCLAVGVFVGALLGIVSFSNDSKDLLPELLPTICEELSQKQFEMILAQPHSCQEYLYLKDQIITLEVNRRSMQEIESEVVLEQLDALDKAVQRMK